MLRDWRESLVLQRVRLLTEAEPVLVSLPLQLREQLPATSRVLASLNRLAELESTDAGPSAGDRLKLDRLAASRADIVAVSARIKKLDAQIPALLKAIDIVTRCRSPWVAAAGASALLDAKVAGGRFCS